MDDRIGIALGDPSGVGPEVTLKALAAEPAESTSRFLLIGDTDQLLALNRRLGLDLPLEAGGENNSNARFALCNPLIKPLPCPLPPGHPLAAFAAMNWLAEGARRCIEGRLKALVTAPVSKESIIRMGSEPPSDLAQYASPDVTQELSGISLLKAACSFTGQTEYLAALAGAKRIAMMLLGADDRERWLRVALVTTHLPLRAVADRLTQEQIEKVIELASEACQQLGLAQTRIGVCGLNPHAGEGGKIGTEEQTLILPAVKAVQKRGCMATGPVPADVLFYQALRGDFDAVVAMYHDQGLAPLKMIAFENGINWTLGLPFIRTSPDHGTAFDIAGQNKASPSSMIAAIGLAKQLIRDSGPRDGG
jgi:4-hydroxythreonine-4-phosphate dehydrogenase